MLRRLRLENGGQEMFAHYINGACLEGKGKPFDVLNPATEEVIARINAADEAQTNSALEAAQLAFKTWSKTSINERIGWVVKLRDALIAEKDTVSDLVAREVGKSYPEAEAECSFMTHMLNFYCEEIKRVYGTTMRDYVTKPGEAFHVMQRYPVGVTVGLMAWNFPFHGAALKLGPALVSGCTCVLKPSCNTPLSTLYLGVIGERIGFPKGVFNVVSGPSSIVGKALNESKIPRLITLIGESKTGRQVMAQASSSVKRFSLELGGNAPAIVMPDADLEETAAFMVNRKTRCCGQGCANINRIYVHENVHEKFIKLLHHNIKKVKVGWGKELGDVMGPQINKAARDRLLDLINDAIDKGAELIYGGTIPENLIIGSYIMPTLLDNVQDDTRLCHEEIFGPILPVYRFSDLEDVIKRANNTDYGLCSYLFSHDSRVIFKVTEELEFGEVLVNNPGGGSFAPLPHVGIKESGVGCDGSFWSLEGYMWMRRVSVRP
jgi:succinate-semialdehyde dehydrogenase/glutarate-semialdehyde dehydrogenase